MDDWMTAAEAAGALGVTRPTLYAYVSRGLLRSVARGAPAQRRYRRDEVERLAHERANARKPALVAQASLDWGRPVLASALTLIEDGRLYYRGRDAIVLAQDATLEDAAALLWDAAPVDLARAAPPQVDLRALRPLAALPAAERCTAAFAWLQAATPAPDAPHAACLRLLRLMTAIASGRAPTRALTHEQLARAWRLDARGADLVRRALVLCADHELNASGFATRCVASTGAAPGACVTAGLAALSGRRHAGVTSAIEQLRARASGLRAPALGRLVDEVVVSGAGEVPSQRVPGFGHPLYPAGDPRATALLALLPRTARDERLCATVFARTGQAPTVDYALVALCEALDLAPGSAYLVFALGRTVGWLAHALEQGRSDTLIRPRAEYTGARPVQPRSALEALPSRIVRRR